MGGAIDPVQLDKILKKFREMSANEGTANTTTPVKLINPLLANFLAQPIQIPKTSNLSTRMTHFQPFQCDEKGDWKDLEPGKQPVYNFRYLDDNAIVHLGQEVFNSLKNNVTESTVPNLMLLAYNLKDKTGLRCFGEIPSELQDLEKSREFGHVLILAHPTANDKRSIDELAKGFCYLAASYMKLYTKPVENYMRIQTHLQRKFVNFYGFSFPFASFHLPRESVAALKSHLECNSILKNSFYNLLYAGEITEVGKSIKEYLYVNDTSFTGLHPYTLFGQVMKTLGVSNKYLASIMYSKAVDQELSALDRVFTNLVGNQSIEYLYQMWRFGRIFDPNFLTTLRTKNCRFFTAVCANVLDILSKESYPNILSITHIVNMDETTKRQARGYALRMLEIHQKNLLTGLSTS